MPVETEKRPRYLTRREAAEFLNITVQTMETWACNGRGPAVYRVGGTRTVRYRQDELVRFAESDRAANSQDSAGCA